MDFSERNREVKKALKKHFDNVSVVGGRGTATGWCEISIKLEDPCPYKQRKDCCDRYCNDHICKGNEKSILGGWGNTVRQLADKEATDKAHELIKGIKFSTYLSDEGCGQEREEMLINVSFLDKEPGPFEWNVLWFAMRKNPKEWQPTTAHMYDEMLGALPPQDMTRGAFLVGEPDHHNGEGFPVYACFRQAGKAFEAQYLTQKEFNLMKGGGQ